ncbi:type IV pilus assembly protein PilQ [Halanaerobium saccharolyticum]|uniref:Type IV pilus assembly protein PilQ n=1 Tax=Halanaerobium saccharolyticum TaxID=43595 RepID=A0A4V3G5U3_9FIRM|nr:type II and III secretion system protein [Halanaerobium saccharolyticum]RAK10618.1 type IV pilus assembly protein PilQ [Halanaerobium saccharolyticum]TDW06625.1 type IV pilus assembly protein PilQ [Halanaerobium saccharolyticum]TDX62260.1 type IV pilus assembly protein PilQ [Halanaerobium saccharolyticum]
MKLKTVFVLMLSLLLFFSVIAAAEEKEELLVSALYFETDIREALNDLMLQSGVSIIADDTVQGLVTLDLEDVSLEKALQMVLLSGGYSYRRFDDYYLVSMADPRSPAFRHMAESRNIKLKYITTSEARDLLPAFYDPFLRGSEERNEITITATPTIIENFIEEVNKIDSMPQQIEVQVVVTEISSDLVKEYGANLFEYLSEVIPPEENRDRFSYNNDSIEVSWYGSPERILANLRALEQNEQLEIKADPRIIVQNRGTGNLFIGEEQVIILEPEDASARLERVEVGISLEVSPRIIGDDEIELNIAPSISHFTEEMDQRLRIRRSEISSTIYTKNNETLVMAGMTIENRRDNVRKVPILGDIPLIRWLFRQETNEDTERELFIFITTEIVNPSV